MSQFDTLSLHTFYLFQVCLPLCIFITYTVSPICNGHGRTDISDAIFLLYFFSTVMGVCADPDTCWVLDTV